MMSTRTHIVRFRCSEMPIRLALLKQRLWMGTMASMARKCSYGLAKGTNMRRHGVLGPRMRDW